MKIPIELNIIGNGVFLNFWNHINGDDVNCEIIDDKLFLMEFVEEDDDVITRNEITIGDFCKLVKSKIES